ncbi:kinase-like domain-containing protein, partial [Crucibulum laeve]
REVLVWKSLNHENLAPFYGLYNHPDSLVPALVSAYIPHNLMEYTDRYPTSRTHLLRQIGAGLKYLHAKYIIHGDIKPDNTRVSASGQAKIIDFGCGKMMGTQGFTTIQSRKPRYAAPELLYTEDDMPVKPTFKSDVFGFGMTVLQVLHSLTF